MYPIPGAIIHYNPLSAESPATFDGSQLFLLDSGGQYEMGTTDVTRTFHLGQPSSWQRECFTRVLKGNIGLDSAIFPENTPGMAIDAFARAALWQAGLDYLHGTGHGVGAALNVHEGPQSISTRYFNTVGLREGMIVSNEPGYYETGAFGIRIENLLVVRRRSPAHGSKTPSKTFLGFEQLTLVPIQTSLMDLDLMSDAEIEWVRCCCCRCCCCCADPDVAYAQVDAYHARVWERVGPRLDDGCEGKDWLREMTRPIRREAAVAR